MRSIPLIAVSMVMLAAAWACGDGGNVEPNNPPVANFTVASCVAGSACQFTDASTDDHGVTGYSWTFGDPTSTTNTSTDKNPVHTYAAAGDYTVTLTVTDGSGETSAPKTTTVTVTAASGNVPPVASFELPTSCVAGTPCGFHSTSTDPDGQIATTNWDFGDQQTGEGIDATHTYAAAGTYNVTLGVTDDDGAPGTSVQQLTVSPASSQDCTTTGTQVDCTLTITQRSTVKFTIVSTDCELVGNVLTVTAPRRQIAFFHMCNRVPGDEYVVKDDTGAPLVLESGTLLTVRFNQGIANPGNPPTGDPGIQVDGGFPSWTLNIDDGGAAGTEGEPDFDDAIVGVQATLAP